MTAFSAVNTYCYYKMHVVTHDSSCIVLSSQYSVLSTSAKYKASSRYTLINTGCSLYCTMYSLYTESRVQAIKLTYSFHFPNCLTATNVSRKERLVVCSVPVTFF